MSTPDDPHRARLAARLRALRAARYRSGNAFAPVIGWQQSRVSKLETGRQLPSERDLVAWAQLTDPQAYDELVELLAAARVEYASWRGTDHRAGGLSAVQSDILRREAAANWIAEYQPGMIPALCQTADYATAVLRLPPGPVGRDPLTDDEIAGIVTARLRRGEVLYQRRRRTQLIVGEQALWAAPNGAVDVLRAQLGKLQSIAALPSVDFGVVPLRTLPVPPLSGFRIYDEDEVVVESLAGEQTLGDRDDVAGYWRAFRLLLEAADLSDAAVTRIGEIAAQLGE